MLLNVYAVENRVHVKIKASSFCLYILLYSMSGKSCFEKFTAELLMLLISKKKKKANIQSTYSVELVNRQH